MSGISGENTIASEQFRIALRNWIEVSGKTQKEAIASLGIPASSIKNFLSKTAHLSLGKMELIAQKIGKDLVDMLAEGRAILVGEETEQSEPGMEGVAPEHVQAMAAFKIVLQNQHDSAAKLIKENVLNYAAKDELPSENQDPTTKRLSA